MLLLLAVAIINIILAIIYLVCFTLAINKQAKNVVPRLQLIKCVLWQRVLRLAANLQAYSFLIATTNANA